MFGVVPEGTVVGHAVNSGAPIVVTSALADGVVVISITVESIRTIEIAKIFELLKFFNFYLLNSFYVEPDLF